MRAGRFLVTRYGAKVDLFLRQTTIQNPVKTTIFTDARPIKKPGMKNSRRETRAPLIPRHTAITIGTVITS